VGTAEGTIPARHLSANVSPSGAKIAFVPAHLARVGMAPAVFR